MAFGINDVASIILGTGIDTAVLRRQALADGTSFEQVLALVSSAINAFNASTDPLIASLTYQVQQREIRVPQGDLTFSAASEYTPANPQRLTAQGWMMQLVQEDLGLHMTWQWMRKALRGDVEDLIRGAMAAAYDAIAYHTLNRLFSSTDTAVESGYSMPLANASAVITYTPPKYQGGTFLSTHSHYNRANGLDDCALANTSDLIEHGYVPPFLLLAANADRATWKAETNFVPPDVTPVRQSQAADAAYGPEFDYAPLGAWRIGYCEDSYVIPHPRIPTTYCATVRSGGPNSPDNVLAVRFADDLGVPLTARPDRDLVRDGIQLYLEFQLGTRNAIGAACALNASSGDYANPTISR